MVALVAPLDTAAYSYPLFWKMGIHPFGDQPVEGDAISDNYLLATDLYQEHGALYQTALWRTTLVGRSRNPDCALILNQFLTAQEPIFYTNPMVALAVVFWQGQQHVYWTHSGHDNIAFAWGQEMLNAQQAHALPGAIWEYVQPDAVFHLCRGYFEDSFASRLEQPFCFPSHPFARYTYRWTNSGGIDQFVPVTEPDNPPPICACAGSKLATYLRSIGVIGPERNDDNGILQCFAERFARRDNAGPEYEVGIGGMDFVSVAASCSSCQAMMQVIHGRCSKGHWCTGME